MAPNLLEHGYAVAAGEKAFASINMHQYHLEGPPYGQCDKNRTPLKYFKGYEMDGCLLGELKQFSRVYE